MPAQRRLANAEETHLVVAMTSCIGQLFAGQKPEIIGGVLAELMSTFLLNHKIPSDLPRQEQLREEILTDWCVVVRQLVAVQDDAPTAERLQ